MAFIHQTKDMIVFCLSGYKYCKYSFYDKKSFKKIDEKTIMFYSDGDVPETVIVYIKEL